MSLVVGEIIIRRVVMAKRLAIVERRGVKYYVDRRLHQLRNLKDLQDHIDFRNNYALDDYINEEGFKIISQEMEF